MSNETSKSEQMKVADALKHSWVYHLPQWIWPFAQLARWERPIGWQLLMWPAWLSFAIALESATTSKPGELSYVSPYLDNWFGISICFILLLFGSFLMRGAGCTFNDIVDVNIDNQVERTRSRPLPSGRVSKKAAILFLIIQALSGFYILIALTGFNSFGFWLGISSLLLVFIYPFMKRITWWPQLFLGLAFSWGALMGWAIAFDSLATAPICLYLGSICWVIGYDTIYAHQDILDDALVGVKSTARLFGDKTHQVLVGFYLAVIILFACSYILADVRWPAWLGLILGAGHMIWQLKTLDIEKPENCLRLFKSNSQFGLILFAGLLACQLLPL